MVEAPQERPVLWFRHVVGDGKAQHQRQTDGIDRHGEHLPDGAEPDRQPEQRAAAGHRQDQPDDMHPLVRRPRAGAGVVICIIEGLGSHRRREAKSAGRVNVFRPVVGLRGVKVGF